MDFESEPNAETTAEILEPHSMDDQGINNDPGKMFVDGLSWQTTSESLRQYFAKFGEINECMVVRDPATKRARGFGFITFADPSSVDKVLAQPVHELDRKKIDPKVAFPKKTQPKMVTKTKKIFIGGLSATSSVDDMKNYFSQFGKIEEAMLMFDKSTNRHRANYAAAACMPRVGYSPGTIVYPAPNYYGLMLAPGDKVYPADFAALSSPPATLTLGTRPDWSRSIFNGIQTAAGYISAPTSPTGPIQPRGFPATPSAVGPQPFDFYTAAPAADFSSLLATSPQNLPQFQLKTPQLIAAYSGYH